MKNKKNYFSTLSGNSESIDRLKNSIKYLTESENTNTHQDKSVTLIWLTGAMIKYAQVIENKDESKETLIKALEISKKNNLGARMLQIESTIKK